MRRLDQLARLFIGTLLVTWAIAGGPGWAYLGFLLIVTGAWGFSPLYAFLKSYKK